MDIQEIFFSQKNFYLLHSLIKNAIQEKHNYDITDEFNKLLLDIMEGIYQNASEEFPQNITVKDAKKRLNMNTLNSFMPEINQILHQKFNPVQREIQQQQPQVVTTEGGLQVSSAPSLNNEYARIQRERDEEQNMPREIPIFEQPVVEKEDNEDPEQKYQKLLTSRQYDLMEQPKQTVSQQLEPDDLQRITLQPSNSTNISSLYGNSSMTLNATIQQEKPKVVSKKENKLQELLTSRNYEIPNKKQKEKINLKLFKSRLTMNNEYKLPQSKQNFRNLKLLRFLLLDDENKSNYYLIKFNETYELVIFNSHENFQYETEDYTHTLEFLRDINILQIKVFDENDEEITNKIKNFFLELELS
jgi:hypothetical protein